MKIIMLAAVAALATATPTFAQRSGTNSPTATHTNPSACLGKERATRNSNGGDRAQGVFGQEQSALARQQAQDSTPGGYGQQTLQPFMEGCQYAPGTTGMMDDGDDDE
jgi:hypothetical protein